MELTKEILKAMESSFVVQHGTNFENVGFIMTYNGNPFLDRGKVQIFATEGAAKSALTNFCTSTFRQGEYWQQYKDNVKKQTGGYEIDMTATIAILPSYGLTARFEDPKNKAMIKELGLSLIKTGIVKIEKVNY